MFPTEPSGFAEMLTQRKESARKTLRETSDGIFFVYHPQSHAGIWFENMKKAFAVGLLGQTSLRLLSEIISERQ